MPRISIEEYFQVVNNKAIFTVYIGSVHLDFLECEILHRRFARTLLAPFPSLDPQQLLPRVVQCRVSS